MPRLSLAPINSNIVYLVDAKPDRTFYLILRFGVQTRFGVDSNLIYKETHQLHLYYIRTNFKPKTTYRRSIATDEYILGIRDPDYNKAIQKFL